MPCTEKKPQLGTWYDNWASIELSLTTNPLNVTYTCNVIIILWKRETLAYVNTHVYTQSCNAIYSMQYSISVSTLHICRYCSSVMISYFCYAQERMAVTWSIGSKCCYTYTICLLYWYIWCILLLEPCECMCVASSYCNIMDRFLEWFSYMVY